MKIFLNYADFNIQKAIVFISQTTFTKIMRDAGINISEGHLGVMMSTVL